MSDDLDLYLKCQRFVYRFDDLRKKMGLGTPLDRLVLQDSEQKDLDYINSQPPSSELALKSIRGRIEATVTPSGVYKVCDADKIDWFDRVSSLIDYDLRMKESGVKDTATVKQYEGDRIEKFIDYIVNYGTPEKYQEICKSLLTAAGFNIPTSNASK